MMVKEAYPLLWSPDPGRIADWSIDVLGLDEVWRAPGADGLVEHVELEWGGCKVSINVVDDRSRGMGPFGVALRWDDRDAVQAAHARAVEAGATLQQPLLETRVGYGFTALDPDGNQWWLHAETGFLDTLRG